MLLPGDGAGDPEEEFLNELSGIPNDLGPMGPLGMLSDFGDISDTDDEEGMYPYEDTHRYSSIIASNGVIAEEEIGALARIRAWNACSACQDESTICHKMWEHAAEAGMARLAYISYTIMQTFQHRTNRMCAGADPSTDTDLSIFSDVEELNRLRLLIPKLRAAQRGMDDCQ